MSDPPHTSSPHTSDAAASYGAASPSTEIAIHDLHRTYGTGSAAVHALRGASLRVRAGERVALVGPSGSGKTTLLNCMLGLDVADAGSVDVFGVTVTSLAYEAAVDWRRDEVAIVFQTPGLLRHLSAAENVDLVLRMRGVNRTQRRDRTANAFERLGIADFATHRPGELSGGQRQRVALARAVATQPRLLIADEPTGELDSDTTAAVLEQLQIMTAEHGTTLIVATHDRSVESWADRTLRLSDGAIHPDQAPS